MGDHWALIPWLNNPEMTWVAVEDLLGQSLPGVRVLLIDQGASKEDREEIDRRIDARGDRKVLPWHWNPMLPSLSAVWNRALWFVWELGGEEALVVNNDVRLHRDTYRCLLEGMERMDALFISAVGVREGQFDPEACYSVDPSARGGPDFSCFLLSRTGHEKYPFDEQFIPAYHEDLDSHRRYMLGGDGSRIFSVNLPFLHYASGTIKEYSPEQRKKFNAGFLRCKEYYIRKWGGPPNEETFRAPFGEGHYAAWLTAALLSEGGAEQTNPLTTTPDLQRYWQSHG
jgi:hypothetical protein